MAEVKEASAKPATAPSAAPSTDAPTSRAAGHPAPDATKKKSDAKVAEPAEVAFGGASLVRSDDPDGLDALVEAAKGEELVVLTAEVIEEFYYPDTLRPSHRVLYNKGAVVAKSEITERAAALRQAQARGSDDPKVRIGAVIDKSTLAAGTWPGIDAATESAK